MKKSLTLLLSAAIVAGSASAAPMAKRSNGKPMSPELLQEISMDAKRPGYLMTRPVTGVQSTPFFEVKSGVQTRRAKAAKSASAGARTIATSVELVAQAGNNTFSLTQRRWYNLPLTNATSASNFTVFQDCPNAPGAILNGMGYYEEEDNTFRGIAWNTSVGFSGTYYEIDMATAVVNASQRYSLTTNNLDLLALAVTKDPTSGKVYGITYTNEGYLGQFSEINYRAKTSTCIKELYYEEDADGYIINEGAELCYLLGTTKAGQVYGVRFDGNLVKIDKTTGEQTVIGQTGYPYEFDAAGCVDIRDNVFVLAKVNSSQTATDLVEVNLETAAATVVATYPTVQFYNMFMVPPAAEDKAPDSPNLTVTAPEGTMSATYTVTLPTTLYDGTPINGAIEWEVAANGEVIADGKNMAGSTITGEYTFETSGSVLFTAVAKNAEGESPKAKVEVYIGKGTPAVPLPLKAYYADGKMHLEWAAVTESNDGGYLNPAEVTYDVMDGAILLAKDLTETSYSFDFVYPETLTTYTYAVVAKYGGKTSGIALSNELKLGPVELPYEATFADNVALAAANLTILDANNDGKTWALNTSVNPPAMRISYNSAMAMDDWMFTPEFKLEAGKMYEFKIMTWAQSASYKEKIEVKMGKGVTPEAMTTEVIPATEVNWVLAQRKYLTAKVIAPETGNFNFGIHGCSKKDTYYLFVSEISVSTGYAPTAPVAPGNIALSPDVTGLLSCNVAIDAPSQDVAGNNLTANVTINLKRDGELIKTLSAVPGATVAYKDTEIPAKGNVTYTASAVSADGEEGPEFSKSVYVGPYAMTATTRAEFFETNQPGTVTVIWDAVTTDINGNNVAASQVKYMVYDVEGNEMLAEPTSNLRATFKAVEDPNKQDFCQFAVGAYNRDQEPTLMTYTNFSPVGKAYSLPVSYTKIDDINEHIMGLSRSHTNVEVGFYSSANFGDGTTGQDDDEFFGMKFTALGQEARIFTGLIDLTTADRPEVSFWMRKLTEDDINTVDVVVMHDGTESVLTTVSAADFAEDGWNKVRLSLADYVGKNVQIALVGKPYKKVWVMIDNIQIKSTPAVDLELTAVTAPMNVKVGQEFDINVEVTNLGWDTAKNFTVNLYRDGDLLDSNDVAALDSDESINVVFENLIGYFDANDTQAIFTAEVVCDADADLTNNLYGDVIVNRPASTYDTVKDLAAETTEDGVKLTWSPYVVPETGDPVMVTEDFENADDASIDVEGWTMLDLDGFDEYISSGGAVPALDAHNGTWTVCDGTAVGAKAWAPASGDKMLISSCPTSSTIPCNNWAISPLLSGNEQTITFWAKALTVQYGPETLTVYGTYEDSVDPDDFEVIETFTLNNDKWAEFSVDLDEGILHFALVDESTDIYMICIDDVTFEASPLAAKPLTLVGYDVYRNGVKIGETDGTGEYIDTESGLGKHIYHVVAKYAEGDSELSNPAEIEVADAGLATVTKAQASVKVDGRDIVISNADNAAVAITTIDGKLLFRANGDSRFTAAPAIYLVTINNRAYKVVVR